MALLLEIFNLLVPSHIILYDYTQVSGVRGFFEIDSHHLVGCSVWFPAPRDSHSCAFARVESHSPGIGPVNQGVKIRLQYFLIFG